MTTVITGYNATSVAPEQWAVIEPFVRRVVAQMNPSTPEQAHQFLSALTCHVHWCWQSAGYPLEPVVIFQKGVIDEFIQKGTDHLRKSTKNTYRSRLGAVGKVLVPWHLRTGDFEPIGAAPPNSPYTSAQIAALHVWAVQQGTDYRRVNCSVLLGLCLGAGLSAGEAAGVQSAHIHVDSEGVLIRVVGKRPRFVPVLAEWEEVIARVAEANMRKEQFLLKPLREQDDSKNLISNLVRETTGRTFPITSQRLRVTWIVHHLTQGTPLVALYKAAGVQSPEALARYAEFVPEMDQNQARRHLRALGQQMGVAWRRG